MKVSSLTAASIEHKEDLNRSYNASSTYKSFLMYAETSTYSKLVDIRDYPDLGGK